MPGGRLADKTVADATEKRLKEVYGDGRWIEGGTGMAQYLNYKLIQDKKLPLLGDVRDDIPRTDQLPVGPPPRSRTEDDLAGWPQERDQGQNVNKGYQGDVPPETCVAAHFYFTWALVAMPTFVIWARCNDPEKSM